MVSLQFDFKFYQGKNLGKIFVPTEAATGSILLKKCVLKGQQLYWKEISIQVFSCEICKIFKNTYFEEYMWMTVSILKFIEDLTQVVVFVMHHLLALF